MSIVSLLPKALFEPFFISLIELFLSSFNAAFSSFITSNLVSRISLVDLTFKISNSLVELGLDVSHLKKVKFFTLLCGFAC